MVDHLRYYDLETYLFDDVHRRFHGDGHLSAFDFFSIVIWKANRAKTKIARRLLDRAPDEAADLDAIVGDLTVSLFEAGTPRDRLRILMDDWGFLLPMASAILTVLWPDDFTVYDIRVCNQLNDHRRLANWTRFDRIWDGYERYRDAVVVAGPDGLTLREKDQFLWGQSAAQQLQEDISRRFLKAEQDAEPTASAEEPLPLPFLPARSGQDEIAP